MVAAVIFDMDDTLLRDDRTISAHTLSVLRKAAAMGIRIIPASGRAQGSMQGFVDQIGCTACYVACNGAEIYGPDHRLLHHVCFDTETAQQVVAFGQAHQVYTQTYLNNRFYYSVESRFAGEYASSSLLQGEYCSDLHGLIAQHAVCKLLMMDDKEVIASLLPDARAQFEGRASVTCSKPHFLEFNPPQATKGQALCRCGELFGFDIKDAIAFGDSLNDVSMLTTAGLGVAMGNARDDVKQQADRICGTNEEDGVARYLEMLIPELGGA